MSPFEAPTMTAAELVRTRSTVARDVQRVPWPALLALHLLPGLLIGAVFVLLAAGLAPTGSPPNLALVLAMLVIALPVELGTLLYVRRQERGASKMVVEARPPRQCVGARAAE